MKKRSLFFLYSLCFLPLTCLAGGRLDKVGASDVKTGMLIFIAILAVLAVVVYFYMKKNFKE